ncbi:MAG: Ldh family oxidoreductase [Chitinophagales bacterium]
MSEAEKAATVRVDHAALREFCADVLIAEGVPEDDARIVADSLVEANLRGVDSHGVIRLSMYVERMQKGGNRRTTDLTEVQGTSGLTVLDAHNGLGQVASHKAMQLAIARARETGLAAVGVRNSSHFGMAAYYSMLALEHDMIGLALSNTNVNMTTSTSAKPGVANNPWSATIPAGQELPVVIDMASSIVAAGKLMNAIAKGEKVPLGWGVDADGRLTDDPAKIFYGGSLLPFGGYKGYAIALLIDVLCGVLTGSGFGHEVSSPTKDRAKPTRAGHFFLALDLKAVGDPADFKARMDRMIADLHALTPAEGVDRVRVPGELEFEAHRERTANGIPLPQAIWEDLRRTGAAHGIEWR